MEGNPVYQAEVAHLAEHDLPKVEVAGSSPVFRSSECANVQISDVRIEMHLQTEIGLE